jgi:hypothetical protein
MRKLLFSMVVGAALMWLFDPDAGARRRDGVRRKLATMGVTGPAAPPPTAPTAVTDYTPPAVASIP